MQSNIIKAHTTCSIPETKNCMEVNTPHLNDTSIDLDMGSKPIAVAITPAGNPISRSSYAPVITSIPYTGEVGKTVVGIMKVDGGWKKRKTLDARLDEEDSAIQKEDDLKVSGSVLGVDISGS